LLRTVGHAWKQDSLAREAQEILTTGSELYDRLHKMGEHLSKLGRALDSAHKAFNETVGTVEKRVLPSARKMGELQQKKQSLTVEPIQGETRRLTAPELTTEE